MSTQQYMAETQAVAAAAIHKQVTRCDESLVSTHNMRVNLSRRLGVSRSQANILVNRIVDQLLKRGVLEYFGTVGRGDVFKINIEQLTGVAAPSCRGRT